jgi:transposase-like protein
LIQENLFSLQDQHIISVAAAAPKAGVKESTTRTWWKKLQENPDTFTLEKKIQSPKQTEV